MSDLLGKLKKLKERVFLGAGMPTCLLCVCIRGSVYCDDTGLEQIPPLPKDTTHFYGRFNQIRHVKNTDFINLSENFAPSCRKAFSSIPVDQQINASFLFRRPSALH